MDLLIKSIGELEVHFQSIVFYGNLAEKTFLSEIFKQTLKGCPESTPRLITNLSGVIDKRFPVPNKDCLPELNSR